MLSTVYTNGVIAVKERALLGEKILRFTEMTAEEVLRALAECNFGGEGEDGEELCRAEENALDAFIRAYAPSKAILHYLLVPRDFHNLKALYKAKLLSADAAPMLGPEGLRTSEELSELLESGKIAFLPAENATGEEIGAAFDKAMYAYLLKTCCSNAALAKLIAEKADKTNLLIAFRSPDAEYAKPRYVAGGKLGEKQLGAIFGADMGTPELFAPYAEFYQLCRKAKELRVPFTEAERALASAEAE